jgi:segregation and condensation protein A
MAELKTATTASPAAGEPGDDPLWDDWDTPPRRDPVPVLHLDGFDGPMDLLLDLAERQRIDLGQISILTLVEQFIGASERLVAHVAVERRAEWLVLATRLVLLRSRLLFPPTEAAARAAEAEAAREVARLHEMRFIRVAIAWMERRPWLGRDVFARPAQGPDPRAVVYRDFLEACLTVLRGRDERPAAVSVYRPALAELFRITETLARLRPLATRMTEPKSLHALLPRLAEAVKDDKLVRRSAVAATFVAALELCRERVIHLEQAEPFETITVAPRASERS